MTTQQLIEGCGRNEGQAWAELWQIVEGSCLGLIRRVLTRWHFEVSLVDDVMQELYRYLQADGLCRLRSFRGASKPELCGYLRTIATRFAVRTVRKWDRNRRREALTLRLAPPPDRTGPTEEEIQAALRELDSIATASDRLKLRKVLGDLHLLPETEDDDSPTATAPAQRTVRHWCQELRRTYAQELR
jgi:DNA-directed RNA polymerase specialized sigma24 family protein